MKRYPLFCSLILILFTGPLHAQERTVLYTHSPSTQIQELAKNIRAPYGDPIPVEKLPEANRYFVRIIERKFVFTPENEFNEKAVLGGPAKPFVFLTTPESFFRKSLLDIYADIGYEAEEIIRRQRNEPMVAILFRYPDSVTLSSVTNGRLESEWRSRIYSTTWDNVLSLFTRLVQDKRAPACNGNDAPKKNICLTPKDKAFVLRFPTGAKRQIKTQNYAVLQARGGSLWTYRKLLEDNLSLFEHFRGDGRTENELLDFRDTEHKPQLIEVIGPNWKISELPEVIIIDLGKLTIEDTYWRSSN